MNSCWQRKIFYQINKKTNYFRNSEYEGQQFVFDESDDTIHYVIGEPIEYDEDSDQVNEYEYVYEEAEETIDDPPQTADIVEDVRGSVTEQEVEIQEAKVFEEKKDGIDIKKEDENAECDICNKVFRTTAVINIYKFLS